MSACELSLADCNKVVQINPIEPRGYNCRGFAYSLPAQYDAAVRDLTEVIRLSPNFAIALEHRAGVYSALQQDEESVQDYTEAIRVLPRMDEYHIRRPVAYTSSLRSWPIP